MDFIPSKIFFVAVLSCFSSKIFAGNNNSTPTEAQSVASEQVDIVDKEEIENKILDKFIERIQTHKELSSIDYLKVYIIRINQNDVHAQISFDTDFDWNNLPPINNEYYGWEKLLSGSCAYLHLIDRKDDQIIMNLAPQKKLSNSPGETYRWDTSDCEFQIEVYYYPASDTLKFYKNADPIKVLKNIYS